ncbi:N-acetyltransferase eco [Anopheles ziemanni]|uniref:N-acetyltransferase eco n=1 Tax=Anopheles coustani TaxID=139045 RepID=UPI00265844B6|nr:N-acetyltransferase eco [Anopheles coustani]XP_058170473.1 N-acetyltransferase eco [Anopheles ziemanni]
METPRSVTRVLRPHAGTPKLSSRKKSLFGKDDSNESDLGPITPLRFGSNRNTAKPNTTLNNITSFRNLFGNESPESERSLSPDFAQRYTNNGRYELLTEGHDKENQHAVDEETRFSFHSIPATPSGRLSAEESALLDESNSNSLSVQMSSDLNLIEKRTLRTPGVTTRNSMKKGSQVRSVEPSFRRTNEQEKSTNDATPNTSIPVHRCHTSTRSAVKARTALHFNDIQTIPTKSFYASSMSENRQNIDQPTSVSATEVKRTAEEVSPPAVVTKPTVPTGKTPRKLGSMRKRSKSFSSNAPRLGQRGVVHKIRKPSKKSSPKESQKESKKREKQNSKQSQKNRAIAGRTKSCPTTPKGTGEKQLDKDDFIQKLQRVKDMLEQGQTRLQRARPLSMTRSMTDLSKATQSCGEEADSSSSEDEDSDMEESQGQNRKFFRSRSGSRNQRKVYNHFNSISLLVRKGGKRKLIDFPQTPKRRRTDFEKQDYFDFETEQQEVDDLINRLDQRGSYAQEGEDYAYQQQQQPHEAIIENEDAINYGDDEPIPIQSNVIYVTMDDYIVDETQMDSMTVYEESMHSSQTIIVRHDDPSQMVAQNDANLHSAMNVDYCADYGLPQITQTQWIMEDTLQTTNTTTTTTTTNESSTMYYPIFYRDRVKDLWQQEKQSSTSDPPQMDVFHALRQQDRAHKQQQRHGTGVDQYQLDAGQRAYGAVQCTECGLTYSRHEPEEELIHDNFHRSHAKLTFAGWSNEHIVTQVPEWDVTGRIIVVSQVDSRQWLAKVQSILEVVDTELGFATYGELPEGGCVYLAIARSTVLGVCVVQPLQYANRMITIDGLHGAPIDCYSTEFYPAKCGISRIWVSPKYRRLGVGRTLLTAIKRHYIFGYVMRSEEIAFGAPTESGRLFAESVTGQKDFLVYL